MADEIKKQYRVTIGDSQDMWDEDKLNRNYDKLKSKYPDSKIEEATLVGYNVSGGEGDNAFSEDWDTERYDYNFEDLKKDFPEAKATALYNYSPYRNEQKVASAIDKVNNMVEGGQTSSYTQSPMYQQEQADIKAAEQKKAEQQRKADARSAESTMVSKDAESYNPNANLAENTPYGGFMYDAKRDFVEPEKKEPSRGKQINAEVKSLDKDIEKYDNYLRFNQGSLSPSMNSERDEIYKKRAEAQQKRADLLKEAESDKSASEEAVKQSMAALSAVESDITATKEEYEALLDKYKTVDENGNVTYAFTDAKDFERANVLQSQLNTKYDEYNNAVKDYKGKVAVLGENPIYSGLAARDRISEIDARIQELRAKRKGQKGEDKEHSNNLIDALKGERAKLVAELTDNPYVQMLDKQTISSVEGERENMKKVASSFVGEDGKGLADYNPSLGQSAARMQGGQFAGGFPTDDPTAPGYDAYHLYSVADRFYDKAVSELNKSYKGADAVGAIASGIGEKLTDADFWLNGLQNASDIVVLKGIYDKIKNKPKDADIEDALNPMEYEIFKAYNTMQMARAMRSADVSTMFKTGESVADIGMFIVKAAAVDKIGGGEWISKAVTGATERALMKIFVKQAPRTIIGKAINFAPKTGVGQAIKLAEKEVGHWTASALGSLSKGLVYATETPDAFITANEMSVPFINSEGKVEQSTNMGEAFLKNYASEAAMMHFFGSNGRLLRTFSDLARMGGKVVNTEAIEKLHRAYNKNVRRFEGNAQSVQFALGQATAPYAFIKSAAFNQLIGLDENALANFFDGENIAPTMLSLIPFAASGAIKIAKGKVNWEREKANVNQRREAAINDAVTNLSNAGVDTDTINKIVEVVKSARIKLGDTDEVAAENFGDIRDTIEKIRQIAIASGNDALVGALSGFSQYNTGNRMTIQSGVNAIQAIYNLLQAECVYQSFNGGYESVYMNGLRRAKQDEITQSVGRDFFVELAQDAEGKYKKKYVIEARLKDGSTVFIIGDQFKNGEILAVREGENKAIFVKRADIDGSIGESEALVPEGATAESGIRMRSLDEYLTERVILDKDMKAASEMSDYRLKIKENYEGKDVDTPDGRKVHVEAVEGETTIVTDEQGVSQEIKTEDLGTAVGEPFVSSEQVDNASASEMLAEEQATMDRAKSAEALLQSNMRSPMFPVQDVAEVHIDYDSSNLIFDEVHVVGKTSDGRSFEFDATLDEIENLNNEIESEPIEDKELHDKYSIGNTVPVEHNGQEMLGEVTSADIDGVSVDLPNGDNIDLTWQEIASFRANMKQPEVTTIGSNVSEEAVQAPVAEAPIAEPVAAEGGESAAQPQTQEPQEPAYQLPRQENGDIDFDKLIEENPEEYYIQASNAWGRDIAKKDLEDRLKELNKAFTKAGRNSRNEIFRQMQAVKEVLDKINTAEDRLKAEEKARAEAEKKAAEAEKAQLKEPTSPEQAVAYYFTPSLKGTLNRESFQKELGFSNAEMAKFFPWWAKKGKGRTIWDLARDIREADESGMLKKLDDSEVRDMIIDLMRSGSISDIYGKNIRENSEFKKQMEEYYKDAEAHASEIAEEEAFYAEHGMTREEYEEEQAKAAAEKAEQVGEGGSEEPDYVKAARERAEAIEAKREQIRNEEKERGEDITKESGEDLEKPEGNTNLGGGNESGEKPVESEPKEGSVELTEGSEKPAAETSKEGEKGNDAPDFVKLAEQKAKEEEARLAEKRAKEEEERQKAEAEKNRELTEEEIMSCDYPDEDMKLNAADYITGRDKSFGNEVSYETIKDYVRTNKTNAERDSSHANGTHLGSGADETSVSSVGAGRPESVEVVREPDEKHNGSDNAEHNGGSNDGVAGNRNVEGAERERNAVSNDSGSNNPDGRNDIGEHGSKLRGNGGGKEGVSASSDRNAGREIEAGSTDIDSLSGELDDLLNAFAESTKGEGMKPLASIEVEVPVIEPKKKKGNSRRKKAVLADLSDTPKSNSDNNTLSVKKMKVTPVVLSTEGMTTQQKILTAKIFTSAAKLGYANAANTTMFSPEDFGKWFKSKFGKALQEKLGYDDAHIDALIREALDTKLNIGGSRMTLGQHLSAMADKEIRDYGEVSYDEHKKMQAKANKEFTKPVPGDRRSISKDLPLLIPGQRDDVVKIETQMFSPEHNDYDHAFGKGFVITNGTGTGKTYTGLGTIRRFLNMGKERILLIAPPGTLTTWIADAKDFGIDMKQLEDTKDKGKGVVCTSYENFRANHALYDGAFDLIVYDECQNIVSNQSGADTLALDAHKLISNKNIDEAEERLVRNTNEGKRWLALEDEKSKLDSESAKSYTTPERQLEIELRKREIETEISMLKPILKAMKPRFKEQAEQDMAKTKVLMLSATPFATVQNLKIAEGMAFNYPRVFKSDGTEVTEEKSKVANFEQEWFSGNNTSEDEIDFAEHLLRELNTMSYRELNNGYDYSRDFPDVSGMIMKARFNAAWDSIANPRGKYHELFESAKFLNDYAYNSLLFEVMKVAAVKDRIQQHLDLGRKVVIYHQRLNESAETEDRPAVAAPFQTIIDRIMGADHPDQKKVALAVQFAQEFKDILKWEKTLDYRPVPEQIMDIYATDADRAKYEKELNKYETETYPEYLRKVQEAERLGKRMPAMPKRPKLQAESVCLYNGECSKAEKDANMAAFNDDNGNKKIIVVTGAAGGAGLNLHDTTGKYPRVIMQMALPNKPILFIQIEGRIYRWGNMSNAIFEYPLLGLNLEAYTFAMNMNTKAETVENLAHGEGGRGLKESIMTGFYENSGNILLEGQGVGTRDMDRRGGALKDMAKALHDYEVARRKGIGENDKSVPEPIGYVMAKIAGITQEDKVMIPFAGRGSIARYVPKGVSLDVMEEDSGLKSVLAIVAGSSDLNVREDVFGGMNAINKADVLLLSGDSDGFTKDAKGSFIKAYAHLNEGGRIVAVMPADDSVEVALAKLDATKPTTKLVADYKIGKGIIDADEHRIVVVDKITNAKLRDAIETKHFDYSMLDNPDTLYKVLDSLAAADRTVDKEGIARKRIKAQASSYKNTGLVKEIRVDDGSPFNVSIQFIDRMPKGFSGARINLDGLMLSTYSGYNGKVYGSYITGRNAQSLSPSSNIIRQFFRINELLEMENSEFKRNLAIGRDAKDEDVANVRKLFKEYQKTIRYITGMSESQLDRIRRGLQPDISASDITSVTDYKTMREKFEAANAKDNDEGLLDLFNDVMGAVEKSGVKVTSGDVGAGVGAHYDPNNHELKFGVTSWNRGTDRYRAETLLHEMIHSVTSYALASYDAGVSGMSDELYSAVENVYNIMDALKKGKAEDISIISGGRSSYILENAHEFLANVTKKENEERLKSRPMWVKDTPHGRKVFGMEVEGAEKTNAYDLVIDAIKQLTANYDKNLSDRYVGSDGVNFNLPEEKKLYEQKMIEQHAIEDDARRDIMQHGDTKLLYSTIEEGEVNEVLTGDTTYEGKMAALENASKEFGIDIYVHDKTTAKGQLANKYGWFNPADGTVHINIDNCKNEAQAYSKVLHETVAHKGLREMFGDDFDNFLDNVYNNVDAKIKNIINEMKKKWGCDEREATEEYLAKLAERGPLNEEEMSVWRKFRQWIINKLRQMGVKLKLTEKDLRAILTESAELLRDKYTKNESPLSKAERKNKLHIVKDEAVESHLDDVKNKGGNGNNGEGGEVAKWYRENNIGKLYEQTLNAKSDALDAGNAPGLYVRNDSDYAKIKQFVEDAKIHTKQQFADSLAEAAKQDFGSADTSINSNKLPTGFGLVEKVGGFKEGTTNLDLGGGRFDNATEMLKGLGVTNMVFDPFNRSKEHNAEVASVAENEGFDTVTCNNCLNVINTAGARSNVILQCAKALKDGGTAYFTVYEGNGSGEGKVSKNDCWQENRKTETYMDEIKQHFGNVERKGKLIIASEPITEGKVSIWNNNPEGTSSLRFARKEYNDALFNKAKEEFGTTNDFREAGYILPDGSMLDFSEKKDGGRPGYRSADHRQISRVFDEKFDTQTEYLTKFVQEGAIRIMPESAGIHLSTMPSPEQISKLRTFIARNDGEVILEMDDENGHPDAYAEYAFKTSPFRVINDIKAYLENGERPTGNLLFSRMDDDFDADMDAASTELGYQETYFDKYPILDKFKKEVNSPWNRFMESAVDELQPIIIGQRLISEASGKPMTDKENVEWAMRNASSKFNAAHDNFMKNTMEPLSRSAHKVEEKIKNKLVAEAKANGETLSKKEATEKANEQLTQYMFLKSGLERQVVIAKRNASAIVAKETASDIKAINDKLKEDLEQAESKYNDAIQQINNTHFAVSTMKTDALEKAKKAYDERVKALNDKAEEKKATILAESAKQLKEIEDGDENNVYYKNEREKDFAAIRTWFSEYVDPETGEKLERLPEKREGQTNLSYNAMLRQYIRIPEELKDMKAAEAKAEEYVKGIEDMLGDELVNDLWGMLREATKANLDIQLKHGKIKKDVYQKNLDDYKFYIPFRGFNDETAEDMNDYMGGRANSSYEKPLVRANGRISRPESPFGHIGAMYDTALYEGVKNDAFDTLYKFISRRSDNGLARIAKSWYAEGADGKWDYAFAPINDSMTPEEIEQVEADFKARMEELKAQGKATNKRSEVSMLGGTLAKDFRDNRNKNQHIVHGYHAGEEVDIIFYGDPRMAQAMNGVLREDNKPGELMKAWNWAMRVFSKSVTSWNPEFFLGTNVQRDLLWAVSSQFMEYGARGAMDFAKELPGAMQIVGIAIRGEKSKVSDELKKEYREYVENGGPTGITYTTDREAFDKYVTDRFKLDANVDEMLRDNIKAAGNAYLQFAESIEQICRFAAYRTARHAGKSIEAAIADSKNRTINFDRRGTMKAISPEDADKIISETFGAEPKNFLDKSRRYAVKTLLVGLSYAAKTAKTFIPFTGAAISALATQAGYASGKGKADGKNVRRRTWGVYAGVFGLALLRAMMAGFFADDDDDSDTVSNSHNNRSTYKRVNKFTTNIPFGLANRSIMWAMPQELTPAIALGDALGRYVSGMSTADKAAKEFVESAGDVLNPIAGNKFRNSAPIISTYLDLKENENYQGMPISRESDFNKDLPNWRKGSNQTWDFMVNLAEAIARLDGGSYNMKPRHEITDINPAKLQYAITSLFGGVFDFGGSTLSLMYNIFNGDVKDMSINDIPLARRYVHNDDKAYTMGGITEEYNYWHDRANRTLKAKEGIGKVSADEDEIVTSDKDFELGLILEHYNPVFKEINDRINLLQERKAPKQDVIDMYHYRDKVRYYFIEDCKSVNQKK